jgi:hypothetical protein
MFQQHHTADQLLDAALEGARYGLAGIEADIESRAEQIADLYKARAAARAYIESLEAKIAQDNA